MGVSWGQDANPLNIYYLIGLVRRQLRIIVAVALAVGALGTLYALMRAPQFTATTLLVVDVDTSELTRGAVGYQPKVDTEVEMLRALNIVESLARRLKFASETEGSALAPSYSNRVESVVTPLGLVLAIATETNGPALVTVTAKIVERVGRGIGLVREVQGPVLAPPFAKVSEAEGNSSARISSAELLALEQKFAVRRRGLTDVIAIEAKAETAERAAKLANLYAEVYLDEQVAAKLNSIERVEEALAQRMDELKAKLTQAGTAIKLRELYTDYLSRLAEIRRRRGVIMPDLRIAAPALPIDQPSFPSTRLLVLIIWLLALGLGVGVAFLRDQHHILERFTGDYRENL